jgi:hypothetical protein
MVELLKLAVEKPISALVILLCVGTLSLHAVQIATNSAVARLQVSQEKDDEFHVKVDQMSDSLVRTETLVESIYTNQELVIKALVTGDHKNEN